MSKSKRDTLIAASYVFYLIISVDELTRSFSSHQLLVQSIPFPSIVGILDVINIERLAPAEHHVRCTWSVNVRPGVGLLTAHPLPTRKGFACAILPCGARPRLTVIRLVGASGDNAVARPAQVWVSEPKADLHRLRERENHCPRICYPLRGPELDFNTGIRRVPVDVADVVRRVCFGHSPSFPHSVDSCSLLNRLSLPDLTPNPGLWWHFFTEMFDHFRPFFLMAFSVLRHPTRKNNR